MDTTNLKRNMIISSLIFISILLFQLSCQENLYAASVEQVNQQNIGVFKTVVDEFFNTSQSWVKKLESSVKNIFGLFFTLELTMLGITALIKRESLEDILGNLVMSALIGGLMYLCIMNYSDFSKAITNGMAEYAGLLNRGATDTLDPLRKGWEIFNHIIHSDVSMIDTFIFFLCGIVILICFTLITIQIIYIKCEASVAIGAGFLLLGFGCSRLFRDYVMNLLRYIICVGFKLFVLHAVLGLGFGFIKDKFILTGALSLEGMGIMIVVSILLLALTKSLPDVAAGIIQGAHVNTGGNLTSTIHQVAHLAAGAAAATAMTARNTPGFVKNVKTAADIARAGGASGAGRVAAQTVRNLAAAREMMMMDSPNAGVNRKMRSKLELMRPPAPPAASSSSEPAQTPKGQGGEA